MTSTYLANKTGPLLMADTKCCRTSIDVEFAPVKDNWLSSHLWFPQILLNCFHCSYMASPRLLFYLGAELHQPH